MINFSDIRSGFLGGQIIDPLFPDHRLRNQSLIICRTLRMILDMAASCQFLLSFQYHQFVGRQAIILCWDKFYIVTSCCVVIQLVWCSPSARNAPVTFGHVTLLISRIITIKEGNITLSYRCQHHTFTFGMSPTYSETLYGCYGPKIWHLRQLRWPLMWKKSPPVNITSFHQFQLTRCFRFDLSSGRIGASSWIW